MQPYNPLHDPLVDSIPGTNQEYAPSYWVATAGTPPPNDGPVPGDINAEVVIVGSGATGIATALHLAEEHGIQAIIAGRSAEAQRLLKAHIEQSKIEVRKITLGMLQDAKKMATG